MTALETAKARYAWASDYYARHAVYARYKVGRIWLDNIRTHLSHVIRESVTAADAIGSLNDKAFFDIHCPPPLNLLSIEWRLRFLHAKYGMDMESLPDAVQESHLILPSVCFRHGRHYLSNDTLWRYMAYLRLTETVRMPDGPATIVELGAGFGSMTRLVKRLHPRLTCVVIDLPETLFFAEVYLRECFPGARFEYVQSPDDISHRLAELDFVLVPHHFADAVAGADVFLMINQNSLGEMENDVIAYWYDRIHRDLRPRYFYSLNRYLNSIRLPEHEWRMRCNAANAGLDARWRILDWEVDPDYERCPYYTTLFTRNLHLVAERASRAVPEPGTEARDRDTVSRIESEDWCLRPYWQEYCLRDGGAYPPLMSRAFRDLTPDLTMTGTLYQLWDLVRRRPSRTHVQLLADYLQYLGGETEPFEELYYYRELVKSLPATA